MRISPVTGRRYACLSDLRDFRDVDYTRAVRGNAVPVKSDLWKYDPGARDQSTLGCCTGEGGRDLMRYLSLVVGHDVEFSPLDLYRKERVIEHTIAEDSGATVRDCMKVLQKYGVCEESFFPFDVSKFTHKPSPAAVANAATHKITAYRRLNSLDDVKAAIASGSPVVFGISVYESFESDAVAKTGIVPMPKTHEQLLGGHCMCLFAYDDGPKGKGYVTALNSWGTSWGDHGRCHLPYDYIANKRLCGDLWTGA